MYDYKSNLLRYVKKIHTHGYKISYIVEDT